MIRQPITSWVLAGFAAVLLGGCDFKPDSAEPQRTVQYYLEHPEEQKAKVAQCNDRATAAAAIDPNCEPARRAGPMDRPSGDSTPLPDIRRVRP